ncbi:putative acyl-CoA transferase/carnitine dehydratase [Galbibacter orientalis DSM 19592]|uniref:Putative acyl-CoA transferase/carnitine dehydratase n=1 Tax=Galbibacter orientalis DSM 19592 TaxID=926559 RepID=I3CAS2_9FLAO|nr:CaiB/BaiF CoA-transferase family protein [Galbibacter orientalis]EIJ40715.1 putative acyl-CoA transferase/carnitine dehydratase [Galbibacter orientalis DSM 19592]
MIKPLEGILVVDFSQYLSGPSASLRLADLGARVIKIEKPESGDLCRNLYFSNLVMDNESSMFHAINRNKESYAADLKKTKDRQNVYNIIKKADVLIHNFRPNVVERLGIDYEKIKLINPTIVYAELTGYGKEGVWKNKPGLDLLIQSLSGLTQLNGNDGMGPVPIGLAVVDILSGIHLSQGILACLYRRLTQGTGARVEVSMLESAIEYQFESITCFFTDGGQPTIRPQSNSAHAYLGAPYGIYPTKDGFMALAMGSIPFIGKLIGCKFLKKYKTATSWYDQRDEIKNILATHLKTKTTSAWLSVLEPADVWCAKVMNWKELFDEEAFKILNMIQKVNRTNGYKYETTRCPIQINGTWLTSTTGSPILGEHNKKIENEFLQS